MNPKLYQILNNMEHNLSQYEEIGMCKGERKRVYHKVCGKHYKGVIAAACVTVCIGTIFLGIPFQGEVKAAFQKVSSYIGSILGLEQDISLYEQVVGNSVTSGGVTLTLNSVVLDQDSLVIAIRESQSKKGDNLVPMNKSLPNSIKVNGTEVYNGAGGIGNVVNDTTLDSIYEFNLNNIDTKKLLHIEMSFVSLEDKQRKWVFDFTVEGSELSKRTVKIPINQKLVTKENSNITLEQLSMNPLGAKIHFKFDKMPEVYDVILKGNDDLGNPVQFYMASGKKEGGVFKLEESVGAIHEKASSLTLTPYRISIQGEEEILERAENNSRHYEGQVEEIEEQNLEYMKDAEVLGDTFRIDF